MYTYSVSGYDVNNKKFSPCSLRSIRKVLQAKSGRCFSEPEESFCGNLRVEGDEQCDAGLLGTEDNDQCCDKNCKLRKNQGAVCSDKNSPCCQNCQFMQAGVKCREAAYATCEQEARCSGGNADCPKSPAMNDGTICQERGQCRTGKCVPYCETQGLQSCMCDVIADACKRCCRMSINETCFAVEPPDILPDGTPCIQGESSLLQSGQQINELRIIFKGSATRESARRRSKTWSRDFGTSSKKSTSTKSSVSCVTMSSVSISLLNLNAAESQVRLLPVTVVTITTLFWIPTSCLISYFDRRARHAEMKDYNWKQQLDLIHPSDRCRRVIHIRVPRQKITVAARM